MSASYLAWWPSINFIIRDTQYWRLISMVETFHNCWWDNIYIVLYWMIFSVCICRISGFNIACPMSGDMKLISVSRRVRDFVRSYVPASTIVIHLCGKDTKLQFIAAHRDRFLSMPSYTPNVLHYHLCEWDIFGMFKRYWIMLKIIW